MERSTKNLIVFNNINLQNILKKKL